MILGNGLSRLLYSAEIDSWPSDLWGCNRAFLEYGARLTRITGHVIVMEEAEVWRDKNGAAFEIWGGHLGAGKRGWNIFTCPAELRKDSGTTMVAQALHEERSQIVCVGFDLGGKDVGSPGIDRQDKKIWVWRWRTLARVYGLGSIRFVGHDHKPFILDESRSATEYARAYMRGRPHITDPGYVDLYHRFSDPPRGRDTSLADQGRVRGRRSNGTFVEYRKAVADVLVSKGELEIVEEVAL